MASSIRVSVLAAIAGLVAAGCTVKKDEAPPTSGPSELATSITLQANPDVLPQDGASQAQIAIFARDANAQPLRGLAVRADIALNGVVQDFGRLSAKNVVTGSDGRANLVYTAPASSDGVDRQTVVTIQVAPSVGDARAAVPRTVDIRLVPPGVISPPGTAVPDFSITPERPQVLDSVLFDASHAVLDGQLVAYSWNFGDGSSGGGRTTQHQYRRAGIYTVTLTVTDHAGAVGTRSKTVQIEGGTAPTAAFVFSPTEPLPNADVFFNAAQSVAAPGRRIVSYAWNFGDGGTATGSVVSHKFKNIGTYNITLRVTDDAGNFGTASQSVGVGVTDDDES
jgi:PKD repeat protein